MKIKINDEKEETCIILYYYHINYITDLTALPDRYIGIGPACLSRRPP